MLGIVMNAAEEAVTDLLGAQAWANALEEAGVDGVYTRLGDYRESDFLAIASAVAAGAGLEAADAMVLVGRHAFGKLWDRRPDGMRNVTDPVLIVKQLDSIIHAEVSVWAPHSRPPAFAVVEDEDGVLDVRYRSERSYIHLCEGLLAGCFEYFGREADVEMVARHSNGADFIIRPTVRRSQ